MLYPRTLICIILLGIRSTASRALRYGTGHDEPINISDKSNRYGTNTSHLTGCSAYNTVVPPFVLYRYTLFYWNLYNSYVIQMNYLLRSGFYQVSGNGSRRAKITHKNRKKLRNFMFWSTGCSPLWAEGFSCSLDVLYGGLGISKLQLLIKIISICFSAINFFQFLVIKTLDPDPDRYSA